MRRWLARARLAADDVDDILQEAYCNLADIDDPHRIKEPAGYFFSIIRNELLRRIKRSRVIPIDAVAGHDLDVSDDTPSAEREVGGRLDLVRLRRIMATLPRRCRRIVEMRKIEGWSQRETAARLGVTETIVENDIKLGILAIMTRWREEEAEGERRLAALGKSRAESGR